jgi:hypothetical protein
MSGGRLLGLGCGALLAILLTGPAAGSDGQWVALFDGWTLDGWVQRNGTAAYRVEGGAIVGRTSAGSPNSFLATTRRYGDFELEFEVKVDDALNSGVQIRSRVKEARHGRRRRRPGRPRIRSADRGRGEPRPRRVLVRRGDRPRLAEPAAASQAAPALPQRAMEPLPRGRLRAAHPDLAQRPADRGPHRSPDLSNPSQGVHRAPGARHRAWRWPLRGGVAQSSPAGVAGCGGKLRALDPRDKERRSHRERWSPAHEIGRLVPE